MFLRPTFAAKNPKFSLFTAAAVGALGLGRGLGASGCGFFRGLAGTNTIDLEKAEVKSMSVDVRKQQKTICPRETVQMAVFAEVALEGEKQAKPFETWQGPAGSNKNDKIDFTEFAFNSGEGQVDGDGWFKPNPNVLATVGKEFSIKTVYKRRPDKFTFTTTYKPDYTCIKGAGKTGGPGGSGGSGPTGKEGSQGQYGSDKSGGGPGGDGGNGGPGGNGSAGQPGPKLVVMATLVKTAFYDKLVALRIGGDMDDFLLVPIDQPIVLRASGGPGGSGGSGGSGGHGGHGGSGNPGGQGGNGGAGGNGGNGGSGGPGGQIDLVFDSRFPEIARAIKLEVSGGAPGGAGGPGSAGSAGSGGSGQGQNSQRGSDGAAGTAGSGGQSGQPGPDGRAAARPGPVKDKMGDMPGITAL